MSHNYTPRRASKRWLEGAPDYVLDVIDHPQFTDRYTVMFTGPLLLRLNDSREFHHCRVQYLAMSDAPTHPQGFSMWGEMPAYQAQDYRYRNKHRRIRWADLPEHIQAHVVARATED